MNQIFKRENLEKGLIAPSILSADFAKLAQEVVEVESAGADLIHVDVMDGHFVPNISIGPVVTKALRPITKLPLDCHLMVSRPDDWLEAFAKAGADIITVHAEVAYQLERTLNQIKSLGCLCGVSINPGTPLESIEEVLDIADIVLIMSVNPGFGGQKFIEKTLDKVKRLREFKKDKNFMIEIDGGVTSENISKMKEAGVDIFVAGSAIFSQADRKKAIDDLRQNL